MTGSWRLFLLCSLLQGAGCMGRFEVLMQARVTTLNGSCVTVPCSFTVEDGYNDKLLPECIPTWRKDRITFSTTTFKGNLTAYNCTTTFNDVLEDNGQYDLRIDCGYPLKYNFEKDPVTIQIEGLPDAPRLTPPMEPVVEGTPVELGCSAPSYCDTHPPTVTWTPALGPSTQLQQNDTVTSTLTFNASLLHHGNNVSCTAAYYIPSGNKTVTSTRYQLSILYAPRNTSAVGSPCLPAREGGCLNLTCSSHANPAVSEFTWYRIHGEHILKIGSGSPLSIQLSNSSNVFFCEVRNVFGTEKSNVYKIDIQTPPRILPASSCSRIAAWVRCSCDSVGRPSPSLEWRLDGKLVSGSEDVSVSQVNLENATLRSSLTMRAPAGLTALTCHSSNAAGNTSQELPVPHLDTQPTLTDQLPWIAATAVLAAGLLFATACAVRAWKLATRTRLGSDALLNKAPPNQENPQVFFRSGEDIYANMDAIRIDTRMNTVGPREEPVGLGEGAVELGEGAVGLGGGAVGLGEEAVGLGEGAVGLGEEAVGLGEGAVGLGGGAAGPREEAVTAADSSALIQRDSEEAADPAAERQVADCDVLYTTVNWTNKKKKKKEI
ncbi:Schwann cell myelin protein-like isoform X2 [Gadus macrocephalus]|uniref:Schwann cell myelin protein-like isoform X2 n=1 Tax=Gadus macrocephalus TaxID=80720 RepID=UPI0028CB4773|nr:Schwann cell myelin protein-like isoform X2 [Gadus macrocephalus]